MFLREEEECVCLRREITLEDGRWGWGGEVSVDKVEGYPVCLHVVSANEAEGSETISEEI